MLGINTRLNQLAQQGRSINIALAGIGQMGISLLSQIKDVQGMKVVAVANRHAESISRRLGQHDLIEGKSEVISAGSMAPDKMKAQAELAAKENRMVFTDSLELLTSLDQVDIVMDATGSPEAGAAISMAAIENKKHMVSLNVEADVTVGPMIKKLANKKGLVYTIGAGDEPGALKELYDFATALGFTVVAAGKGKNNPLDRSANPTTLADYSKMKGANPRMMTSFVDGTKSMEEMACFSNATGILPDVRGMHGPQANVDQLTKIFASRQQGGILNRVPAVDFAIGDVAPGVFLVYTTTNQVLKDELKYLLFGDGPNYLLYRPYHLASMEVPLSAALAYFYQQPTITPLGAPRSQVITVAKKDLAKGEFIDSIGGYTVYGLIEEYHRARSQDLIPLGMVEGAELTVDVAKGQPITSKMVNIDEHTPLYKLRKMQEQTYG
ncbi:MAG: NAD(P)-dependent oxidoreductase [Actinomycetia bacterium]|nr:NAD(P)-dependent oxidoreductase [Actinomycetes bacterium]